MGRKKRRVFSASFKTEVVLASLQGRQSGAEVCRERDITENLLSRWKAEFLERAPSLFEQEAQRERSTQIEQSRIAELERLVGRQALELEVLKKAGAALGFNWMQNER